MEPFWTGKKASDQALVIAYLEDFVARNNVETLILIKRPELSGTFTRSFSHKISPEMTSNMELPFHGRELEMGEMFIVDFEKKTCEHIQNIR